MFPAAPAQAPLISTFFEQVANRIEDYYTKHPVALIITSIALGILLSIGFVVITPLIASVEVLVGISVLILECGIMVEFAVVLANGINLPLSDYAILLITCFALTTLGLLTLIYLPPLFFSELITTIIACAAFSLLLSGIASVGGLTLAGIMKLLDG